MAVVGSAEIIVRAITKQVRKDIKSAFDDVRPVAAKAGRDAGADFAGGFSQTVNQRLRPALSRTMGEAGSNAAAALGNAMDRDLGRTVTNATSNAGKRAGQEFADKVVHGVKQGSGLKGIGSYLFGELTQGATQASNALTQIVAISVLAGGAISGLVGMASAAASGLFMMGAAAGQAAGAIGVLPGVISVALQGFAALKLAFSGVGEAVKAGAKSQAAAVSSGGTAAAGAAKSNEALKRAMEELAKAKKAATAAQEDLNKAMGRAKDGAEEQRTAEALLAKAHQDRARILSDPNATASDGAQAQESVSAAIAANDSIKRSREKNMADLRKAEEKDANARARVADAEDAVNKARAANNKAGAASSPAVKAANAYADALKKLSPEAQAFVKTVMEMRNQFSAIGRDAQDKFFGPVNDGMEDLLKSQFMPLLKEELPESARILGETAESALKQFSKTENMSRFGKILEGNNKILETFNKENDSGRKPIESLVNIVLKLAEAVQPLTTRFADWIGTLITGLDASDNFASNQKLTQFFNDAGDVAAQLGDIIGNIVGGLGNLGDASSESGQGLLDSFQAATQSFEDWSQKLIGDKGAEEYFAGVKTNLEAIGGLIVVVSQEFGKLGDNSGISDLATSLEPAVENIRQMFDNFNDNGGALGEFAEKVTAIMLAFTDSTGIGLFLNTLNAIMEPIKWFLGTNIGKTVLAVSGAIFMVSRALSFAKGIAGFFIKGLIGGFINAGSGAKKFRDVVKNAMSKVRSDSEDALDGLTDDADDASEDGEKMGKDLISGLMRGLEAGESEVVAAASALRQRIAAEIVGDAGFWQEAGNDIALGLAKGIREKLAEAGAAGADLGEEALKALKDTLGIASPSKVFAKQGEHSGEGFVDGIQAEIGNAFDAGRDLAQAAAKGADSVDVVADVKTPASGGSAASSANSAAGAGVMAVDTGGLDDSTKKLKTVGKEIETTGKKSGKAKGGFKALGGGIKLLSGGLLGLVGGPIGAIMLLITGLTMLYKKSPEFKKFVDGIVKAVMPFVTAIKDWVMGALEKLFGWINANMPTIKAVFTSVWNAIKAGAEFAFNGIKLVWDNVLKPVFDALKFVFGIVYKVISGYLRLWIKGFRTAFSAIKGVWDNVLRPVFDTIKTVGQNVFEGVAGFIDKMKSAFNKAKNAMTKAKEGIVKAFEAIKEGAKTPVKWVVDTVWNNGIASLADKIPGVDAKGWKVDTSGWASGGWTGPGRKHDVAGLVHADEYVIKKSARQVFERDNPGLLDFINRNGRLPNSAGYSSGGRVTPGGIPGYFIGGAVKGIGGAISGVAKKTWDVGSKPFKAAGKVVKDLINWFKTLPTKIKENMSGGWGETFQGIPKGAASGVVNYLNQMLPDALPGVPIKSPFPNVNFREFGGRVRKGMPYVVGEKRPELFIPDSSGTIMPNLESPSARKILDALQEYSGQGISGSSNTANNVVNSGSNSLTVNINNPAPERSSQSVSRTIRSNAVNAGWSI